MILNTGSIKFYDGFVYHKRNGAKEHFFKNNINAIFIELINNNDLILEKILINLFLPGYLFRGHLFWEYF